MLRLTDTYIVFAKQNTKIETAILGRAPREPVSCGRSENSNRDKLSELRIANKLAPTILLNYVARGIVLLRVRQLSG